MQRRRIQPKKKPPKRTVRKKISKKKPPVPFSEMVLNWVIIILAVVILAFFASMIWRVFMNREPAKSSPEVVTEPAESVQETIRIEVLNGCGERGIAAKFTDYLRREGFDVVNTGNYRNFDVDSSFVIDRRSMLKMYGKRLANSLGISSHRVAPILSEEMSLEATLVLGKDYQSLRGYAGSARN